MDRIASSPNCFQIVRWLDCSSLTEAGQKEVVIMEGQDHVVASTDLAKLTAELGP